MPRYEIRLYYTYVDAYHVEAHNIEAAEALVDAYEQDRPDCVKVLDNQYNDYSDGWWEELDEHDRPISDPQEL